MNLEVTTAALSMLQRAEDFARVVVLGTSGSSPRHSGAAMLVTAGGSIVGTIGGGPLEATAIATAIDAISEKRSRVSEFESAQLGMMCGGAGVVLTEFVDASSAAQAEFFRGVQTVLRSGRKGWVITVVPSTDEPVTVRKCVVDSDGAVVGDQVCSVEAVQTLAKGGGTYDRVLAETEGSAHIQPIGDQGTAYVFGAGHCGQKLVAVLSTLGFATVVIDDRSDFANAARFPSADRIVVPESFAGVVPTLPIDENSYVVIVTRGHAQDRNVLAQALHTPARYIGMIGSNNKVAQTYEILRHEGFSDADLARVRAPIGLSIGAETPEEIAISIAAQLVQVRAGLVG